MLGKNLRSRYNDFLGPFYMHENVEAVSSDSPRARMSLQLALLGLYPPIKDQLWNEAVNWQPVLTSFRPSGDDPIFVPQKCDGSAYL